LTAANPDASEEKRNISTVARRRFFSAYDEFVLAQSGRLQTGCKEVTGSDTARIQRAYQLHCAAGKCGKFNGTSCEFPAAQIVLVGALYSRCIGAGTSFASLSASGHSAPIRIRH